MFVCVSLCIFTYICDGTLDTECRYSVQCTYIHKSTGVNVGQHPRTDEHHSNDQQLLQILQHLREDDGATGEGHQPDDNCLSSLPHQRRLFQGLGPGSRRTVAEVGCL